MKVTFRGEGAQYGTGRLLPQLLVILVGAGVMETAGLVRPGQGLLIQNALSEQTLRVRDEVAEVI